MIIRGKMFPYRKQIVHLFELAGDVLKEDFSNVSVSVNFVGEDEIKELNKKFRDVDAVTDVLSFPNLEKKSQQPLKEFSDEIVAGELFVGDIVICKKRAFLQAHEFGHSRKREVCFLALHGLLHLLGYDHMTAPDEKIMFETAESILQKAGISR